jgi:choline monooxygenase
MNAAPLATLRNLDTRYYVDSEVFQAERQSIFRRYWQMLGPVSRLQQAGDYLAVDVAGWKLFAMRGRDGELRAFHNVCRHRGARLLPEGQGRTQLLRCPYHQWVYEQTGALRQAPWFGEDPCFNVADWPLEKAHLAEWRGLLFIALDPEVELIDQLGDLPGEVADHPIETYVAVEERRFAMRSNWKTYTDTSSRGTTSRASTPASCRSSTSRTSRRWRSREWCA